MRAVIAILMVLNLAFAAGWVLPFDGRGGAASAYALAESLDAPDPILAGLALPEPPWTDGWRLLMPSLARPAGARMVAEATGLSWVLTGEVLPDGFIRASLAHDGRVETVRLASLDLVARWAADRLKKRPKRLREKPELEPILRAALEGNLEAAAQMAEAKGESRLASRLRRYASAGRGPADLPDLPPAVARFWQGLADPKAMPDTRMGLVWKAFFGLRKNPSGQNPALEALLKSPLLLHQSAALLLLHAKDDPRWLDLADALPKKAPRFTWAFEMQSFAAFERNEPQKARRALLQAIRLEPDESLYWTNLGWANYLLGDLAGAELASVRALQLEPNPTAHYNLGLIAAIQGRHLTAQRHYQKAVSLDQTWEIESALKDLKDAGKPELAFWQGFLLTRAGEADAARKAYEAFIEARPDHVLVPMARRARQRLAGASLKVTPVGLALRPEGGEVQRIGAGEPFYLEVVLEGDPALPHRQLVAILRQNGAVVSRAETTPPYPPNTAAWRGRVGPLEAESAGKAEIVLELGGARAIQTLTVGESNLARKLYARGIVLTDLGGRPLLEESALLAPKAEDRLIERLIALIKEAAPIVAGIEAYRRPIARGAHRGEALPAFLQNPDPKTVRAYLEAVLKTPELAEPNAVEGFVRWLLETGE